MFPTFDTDQQILYGDQYVPDMRYLPNIKMEPSYFETCYPSSNIDLNSTKFSIFPDKHSFQTPLLDGYHTTTTNTNLLNLGREPSPNLLGHDADLPINPNLPLRDTDEKPQKIAKKTRTLKSRNSSTCGKARSRLSSDTGLPREKDRARQFNEAFEGLRKRIPSIPASKKLSKIEILRLAICYMAYLKFVTTDDPFSMDLTTTESNTSHKSKDQSDL